jgi:hypothetical protein
MPDTIPVPVEIRAETATGWCFRVLGATGFRRDTWVAKTAATFTRDDALSLTPCGARIVAGYLTLPRGLAAALGHTENA